MTFREFPARLVLGAALLAAVPAGSLLARDIYKPYLDYNIPHHKAALDTLKRLETTPNDASLHNDLGCLIAWDGFWRDALREFDKAADLDRKDGRPLFNAGLVRGWLGEWGSARRSFKKAVKRDPGNWTAWWMMGYAEERLGNDDAAVAAYKVSLRVDSSLFDVRFNPFAASTRLRARTLLESQSRRSVEAALPFVNELADPVRIGTFFQAHKPAAAAPAPEEATRTAGPVVTMVPSSGSSTPAPRTFEKPAYLRDAREFVGTRPVGPRPEPPQMAPPGQPASGDKPGTDKGAPKAPPIAPGPGGGDD